MKAVRIEAPGAMHVVDLPQFIPAPGEAVVDVAFAGICGSDVELFTGTRPAEIVRYPVVPGHEWSGIVAHVGSESDVDLVGAKVVGEGFSSCRHCARCAHGETVVCESRYDEIGFTRPGAWAQQLLIPVAQLHRLAASADLRSAAGLEPAACAADAVQRAGVAPGDRVAVIGGGTMGCLVIQLLRTTAPSEVVVVEPSPRAMAMARRCGATNACDPESIDAAGAFDVVIEAAGGAHALKAAVSLTRRGGRLVMVGVPKPDVMLNAFDLLRMRTEVHTVFGAPRAAWSLAVQAFTEGSLDPGVLVTHELDLGSAREALALLQAKSRDVGKVLLRTGDV